MSLFLIAALAFATPADAATPSIAGTWTEVTPVTCGDGAAVAADPLLELVFSPDGNFSVTWEPFETYRDYWGTYTYTASGELNMHVTDGNALPPAADLAGHADLAADGALVLKNVDFGPHSGGISHPAGCEFRFKGLKSNG